MARSNFEVVTESVETFAKHIADIVNEDCSICPAVNHCTGYGGCQDTIESYYADDEDHV